MPLVLPADYRFEIGKARLLRDGRHVGLVSTGIMTERALAAADLLDRRGIRAAVLHASSLKPFDTDAILAAAAETRLVVTLEEHSIVGGLGSAVAELLAETPEVRVRFKRLGLPPSFSPYIGAQDYLLERHGLTAEAVAAAVKTLLEPAAR